MTTSFADLWFATQKACETPIPAKEDFPLEILTPFLPRLAMTKSSNGRVPHYYFYGTGLIQDYGKDHTGLPVTEGMTAQTRHQFVIALENAKTAEKMGLGIIGRWLIGEAVLANGQSVQYEALNLPYFGPRREIRRMSYGVTLSCAQGDGEPNCLLPETSLEKFDVLQTRPDWLQLGDRTELMLND